MVACVALVAPSTLVIVFAPPSPTWPGSAASIMQLVTSVYAPSSVSSQQQAGVAGLNHMPSGLEKSLSASSPDRLTSAAAVERAPNR